MSLVRIDGYPMDLAISEAHSFPGEVTKYPVESGPDIGDHIRDLPEEITLECIVSDSPIGEVSDHPSRQNSLDAQQALLSSGFEPETPLPSVDALAKLREIKARRQPVTVETSLGTFLSMAFVDLDVPRDKDKNNALFFTAKFTRINIVTNKRVRARVKTAMPTGAGTKAVAGKALTIERRILWRHGKPPGGAVPAGDVPETVLCQYDPPKGQTQDQAKEVTRLNPGSAAITYLTADGATLIIGARRAALVADLQRNERNANVKTDDQGKAMPDRKLVTRKAVGMDGIDFVIKDDVDNATIRDDVAKEIGKSILGPIGLFL